VAFDVISSNISLTQRQSEDKETNQKRRTCCSWRLDCATSCCTTCNSRSNTPTHTVNKLHSSCSNNCCQWLSRTVFHNSAKTLLLSQNCTLKSYSLTSLPLHYLTQLQCLQYMPAVASVVSLSLLHDLPLPTSPALEPLPSVPSNISNQSKTLCHKHVFAQK